MVQYVRRSRTAALELNPGETKVFRLLPMTRGAIVIDAYEVNLPRPGIPRGARPRPGHGDTAHALLDTGSGYRIIRDRGDHDVDEPTKATDLTIELLHGNRVVASDANHITAEIPGMSKDWFLRISRRTGSRGAQRYGLDVNYPSTLPILERRIPMAFFRQGFEENWNKHPYVKSFRLHGDRATVHLDGDFAAIYGLSNPLEISWSVPILDFRDVNSRSIRFSAGAARNPRDDQSGESPYFSCTIECESEGTELDLTGQGDEDLRWLRFEFRFYLVAVGTAIQYVAKVISPLLDSIEDWIPRIDIRATIISAIESFLDGLQRGEHGNRFSRFITPWLLGDHYAVVGLSFDRPTDQIVVKYIGSHAEASSTWDEVNPSPQPEPLAPALANAPALFDVPAEIPRTTVPDLLQSSYESTAGNLPEKFDHIVVLMMENRSFDQVLGYLSRDLGRTDVDGLAPEGSAAAGQQRNRHEDRDYRPRHITDTAWISMATPGPAHEHESVVAQMSGGMAHFVSNYAKRVGSDQRKLQRIMDYYGADELKAYTQLVNQFAICDHWFCSHVGPTWPNRFIAFTGHLNRDAEGEPELNQPDFERMTPIEAKTIFDHLTERNVSWRCYEHGYSFLRLYTRYTFDLERIVSFNHPTRGFLATAARGELPAVTWIEPDYIDLPPGNDDHPPADMADGQVLVAKIVKALVESPQWPRTLLIITYDEHGGFYDHVSPPEAAPLLAPSQFRQLGPRVPAFVVSPYVTPGKVAKTVFDHTTIAATILRRFCSPRPPRLSPRADSAKDLRDLFDRTAPRTRQDLAGMLAQLSRIILDGGIVRDHRAERSGQKLYRMAGPDDFHAALTFARLITGSAP